MASPPEQMDLKPCPLLEKMSAELRNEIWELAFTPDHDENEKVELFKAQPPQNSLLLTCHQIYDEAKGLHRTAHQNYWKSTDFIFSFPPTRFSDVEHAHFRGEDVDRITKLQAVWNAKPSRSFSFSYVHGTWVVTTTNHMAPIGIRLSHNLATGTITSTYTEPKASDPPGEPLHKHLLLFIKRLENRPENGEPSFEEMDYLACWGCLRSA